MNRFTEKMKHKICFIYGILTDLNGVIGLMIKNQMQLDIPTAFTGYSM